MADIIPINQHMLKTKKDYALAYAAIGWRVFPCWWVIKKSDDSIICACGKQDCKSPGKHPHPSAGKGQLAATIDTNTINKWWNANPNANIAVYLAPSNMVAVDIDPRNGGIESIEILEDQHGPIFSDVLQYTGGGGEHRVFTVPDNMLLPGKLANGVDLKQNGYIMVEPSSHISGKTYEWEGSSNPLEGETPSPLPDWMRDISTIKQANDNKQPFISRFITEHQITELRSALTVLDCDDRETWQRYGHALKTIGAAGFQLWDEWSQQSNKYDYPDQLKTWRSFRPHSINIETIFKDAYAQGWNAANVPLSKTPIIDVSIYTRPESTEQASTRVAFPGILSDIEDYYNRTAKIPQPDFAQQTALGIVSVLLGRRYKTVFDDFTSLYFLNIAGSACGKEHIKKVTETILDACDMSSLIGGDSYTSGAGVLSALKEKPVHISVIDEFGLNLEASNNKNNFIGRSANTSIMECSGRLNGVLRSKNYSTHGTNTESSFFIKNPALTLHGLTTPTRFYENLTIGMVQDGFFGRFITHHSKMPRVPPRKVRPLSVPDSIIEWVNTINMRVNDLGNTFLTNPKLIGEQCSIDVSADAEAVLYAFACEMVRLMNELESEGLDSMVGRSGEFAGRIALTAAMSRDPMTEFVTELDAVNATDYMRDKVSLCVDDVRSNLIGSEYQNNKNEILAAIRASENGFTERDMYRQSPFNKFKGRDLMEILQGLIKAELIALVNTREGKPGKPRNAFVALELA